MPRIAIVSTAHIHTNSFVEKLNELTGGPEVIWDDMPERGEKYAAKGNCKFEPDLDAVLSNDDVEGFVICAENTRHLPLLEKLLPVGKPVMCEKPVVTTTADAQAVAKLCQTHGTTLISGYFQPFLPNNRGVKKILEQDTLGQVTHATFRNAHHAAYGRWFDNPDLAWFVDPELSGGGAMMDMGTHAVHLLRHLFGPVTKVWATCGNYSGIYTDVDDYGLIEMQFASGMLGRVEAGWIFTGGHGGLEVFASKQSIKADGAGGLVMSGPKIEATAVPKGDPKPDRIGRLIAAIQGALTAEELAEDLAACLDAVTIMAAAYESANTGTWVDVQLL